MRPELPAAKRSPSLLPLLVLACAAALPACTPAGDSANDASSAEATESPASPADLAARVEARLATLDATSSLYAKHIPTGREIAIRPDLPMNTLSVIKIPIMVKAFQDHAEGRLDLDARHTVEANDMRRGSGLIQTFAPGLNPTLRGLVTQMIITSDNTATDMVIDLVDMDRVNEMLAANGYEQTRLKHTTHRLFLETWIRTDAAYGALGEREVFERGFPSDEGAAARFFEIEGDSTVWLGRTTAREMARLLEQIMDGELADQAASDEMVQIMNAQFYTTRLPRIVRFQGVQVAHKTGDWPPYAGNDVGILFYDGGPTIVSVFTNQSRGDFYQLEETLGMIAQDIVEAWR
ncbi:MAG: class A beta-lactamase-related serine hydrolase [Gemmatimonadetes bacterium]|nr:class A beta-lactamase-related serine hydrolase [Gemmatimonadota bacterium]MCY3677882.1 class A beta-lactamase-related serine hydrolase [Gemmatimonadota bacterium]MYA41744.1 serine hydrolase [Gemmatimonadota bacterium]MYJ09371.1 serine hydrolase [Gemmatimonadota bacterium]